MNTTNLIEIVTLLAQKRNLKEINRLLTSYEDLKFVPRNELALGWAAKNGHLKMVNYLLEIPEVLARATIDNNYAMNQASQHGRLEVVERLLEVPEIYAQVAARDDTVYRAASHGHAPVFARLLQIPEVMAQVIYCPSRFLLVCQHGHLAVINRLLEIPEVKNTITTNNNQYFRMAARLGRLNIVNRFLEIPEVRALVTANHNEALRQAAGWGHIRVVKCLLEIPEVRALVTANHNEALRMAAQNGRITVVEYLINFPEVVAQIGTFNNAALRSAADTRCLRVVLRLLELPQVRQGNLVSTTSFGTHLIAYGLKRALWLDLQKLSGFKHVKNFSQLISLADEFLGQQTNWMGPIRPITVRELVASLKDQVLSLRHYGYVSYVNTLESTKNPSLIDLSESLTDTINAFIKLPYNLQHFENHQGLRLVAASCLNQWSRTAKARLKDENPGIPLPKRHKPLS